MGNLYYVYIILSSVLRMIKKTATGVQVEEILDLT